MRGALLLACVWLLTGCRYIVSEPYPSFTFGKIAPDKLPHPVLNAFGVAHPDRRIERVETESFRGNIQEYRIWFRSDRGELDSLIFEPDGQQVVAPGRFIPAATPETNQRAGGQGRIASFCRAGHPWPALPQHGC
jgi:hypothetical protein